MHVPASITVRAGRTGSHLQGIAYDPEGRHLYLSFTTCLIKADLTGRVLASVEGIVGHLGCIAWNGEERRVYASLEYKNDEIGRGILKNIGHGGELPVGFYMARFDADKMDRPGMDAAADGVMEAVYLQEVYEDFTAPGHRYGCSGIDGCTFAPAPGGGEGERYLYVAYGIYDNQPRNDNDRQVLLAYDVSDWDRYARPLQRSAIHRSGPDVPAQKLFVYTGSTHYGIQNLEYDSHSRTMMAAVYPGKKPEFPNYSLFFIDAAVPPQDGMLALTDFAGHSDHRFCGSHFPYGAEGLCALGGGYFYIGRDRQEGGEHSGLVELWRFDGEELTFHRVEE